MHGRRQWHTDERPERSEQRRPRGHGDHHHERVDRQLAAQDVGGDDVPSSCCTAMIRARASSPLTGPPLTSATTTPMAPATIEPSTGT